MHRAHCQFICNRVAVRKGLLFAARKGLPHRGDLSRPPAAVDPNTTPNGPPSDAPDASSSPSRPSSSGRRGEAPPNDRSQTSSAALEDKAAIAEHMERAAKLIDEMLEEVMRELFAEQVWTRCATACLFCCMQLMHTR